MRGSPLMSRRAALAVLGAGPVLLASACTSFSADPGDEPVTPAQVDQLADRLAAQEALVAAYAAAFSASPGLAAEAAVLAGQCTEQRDRLRAAAPSGSGASSTPAPTTTAVPAPAADPAVVRTQLRDQVAATAASHAAAAPDFPGARAALLGSIAAGLRGQEAQLA